VSAVQEDYVTDTPYTWGFYSDFNPLQMSYIARLNGLTPPDLGRPFRFLDLGCGNGLSVNTYAACYPDSEFHGVDFNPEHVRNATRLADEGKLSNVTFHESSFADFLGAEVGPFDFIALHGVYSWVGPDIRREVREILDRKLRPGGYAYVSYNAMPGWAALLPLRQIMLAYTGHMEVPTIERVKQGLRYLTFLRDNGAAYFANNTAAHERLDGLLKYDPKYVAHEFFHKYWTCFYFEEVARDMRECGLAFAGSIPTALNIRELSIPQKFRDLMQTAPNRVVYETHKGFVLNEMFRRDLYVKLPVEPLDADPLKAWGDCQFGPLIVPERLRMQHRFPVGDVSYTGPIYPVLTDVLMNRSMTVREMTGHPQLSKYSPQEILGSLHYLASGGQFGPLAAPLCPRPDATSWRLPASFNRALLADRLLADDRLHLASPVAGTGIGVDFLGGLMVLALDQAGDEEPEAWALSFLKRHDRKIHVDGKAVEGDVEQQAVLRNGFARFRSVSLKRLADYGVVEARPEHGAEAG
jgi:SAM-dependent methyltransferase